MSFWSAVFLRRKRHRGRAEAAFAIVHRLSNLDELTEKTLKEELPALLELLDGLDDSLKDKLLPRLLRLLEQKSDRTTEIETIAALLQHPGCRKDKHKKILCKRAANASYALGDIRQARFYVTCLDNMPGPVTGPQIERVREELDAFDRIRDVVTDAPSAGVANKSLNYSALYVLHNCLPFSSAGYAVRSHFIAKEMSSLASADGFDKVMPIARLGYPFDAARDPQIELPGEAFRKRVDDVEYRFFGPSSRAGRVYSYLIEASEKLSQTIRDDNINILHAASNFYTALPAMLSARRASIPFIYEVRSFWELTRSSRDASYENTLNFLRDKLLEDILIAAADHVVTLTNAMKDHIITRSMLPGLSVSVVPNCVDTDFFSPRPRDRALAAELDICEQDVVIGYIGSFVPYEGLSALVDAFATVRRDCKNIKLLLVGERSVDGAAPTANLREQALELDCSDAVVIVGRISLPDVPRYYSLIDIAPFPRESHPITELVSPLKPLEALAMGKCVLVSAVGGMREQIVDGETGIVLGKGPTGLEAELRMAVQQPDRRRQLGENARRWVARERRWVQAAAQMKTVYQHVLSDEQGVVRRQRQVDRLDYVRDKFDQLADLANSSKHLNASAKRSDL